MNTPILRVSPGEVDYYLYYPDGKIKRVDSFIKLMLLCLAWVRAGGDIEVSE